MIHLQYYDNSYAPHDPSGGAQYILWFEDETAEIVTRKEGRWMKDGKPIDKIEVYWAELPHLLVLDDNYGKEI